MGDEEDSGKLGAISRKEKAARKEEKRTLTGQAGKSLYIEALQLLLRTQIGWLINAKGHVKELETTVRDLWDLRIRGFKAVEAESTEDVKLEMFSSQLSSSPQTESIWSSRSRAQNWNAERGLDWPMPGIRDTIALCYLGCSLLRLPSRIGEFVNWANDGHLPYKQAVCLMLSCELIWPKHT